MIVASRITPVSAALDRACVNAIREMLGLAPLYGQNGDRRTDVERFHVDTTRSSEAWGRMHRPSGEHVPQGLT